MNDEVAKKLFEHAKMIKNATVKDGDGDGLINDGTPQEQPASSDVYDKSKFLAKKTEAGVTFETGKPVKFRFTRNTSKSPKPTSGDRYQQAIEPAGRYLTHKTHDGQSPPGWVDGEVEFKSPLVLKLNAVEGNIYDDASWKKFLHHQFKAKGKALSKKIRAAGFDGIVTVDKYGTSEIVDLNMVSP